MLEQFGFLWVCVCFEWLPNAVCLFPFLLGFLQAATFKCNIETTSVRVFEHGPWSPPSSSKWYDCKNITFHQPASQPRTTEHGPMDHTDDDSHTHPSPKTSTRTNERTNERTKTFKESTWILNLCSGPHVHAGPESVFQGEVCIWKPFEWMNDWMDGRTKWEQDEWRKRERERESRKHTRTHRKRMFTVCHCFCHCFQSVFSVHSFIHSFIHPSRKKNFFSMFLLLVPPLLGWKQRRRTVVTAWKTTRKEDGFWFPRTLR